MPDFLITYDLNTTTPDSHRVFVSKALDEGLTYVFLGTDKLKRLPDTTLWGDFSDRSAAQAAFDRALDETEAKIGRRRILEKRFICDFDGWTIRSDKSKAPESKWTKSTPVATCIAHQRNDPFFAY